MIELGCATCANPQDVPSQTKSGSSTQAKEFLTTTNNNNNNNSKQQDQQHTQTSTLAPLPSANLWPLNSINQQKQLNYLNLLQSVPSQLLLASSAPSLIGPAGSGVGSGQFALTPDARACVTATYLCVLIVNNTWLDCNLLEMLCNNSSNSNSSGGGSGSSSNSNGGKGSNNNDSFGSASSPPLSLSQSASARAGSLDKGDELSLAEGALELSALDSALNELIAFAGGGGGSDTDEGGGSLVNSAGGLFKAAPAGNFNSAPPRPAVNELATSGNGAGLPPEAPPPLQLYSGYNQLLLNQLLLYGQTLQQQQAMEQVNNRPQQQARSRNFIDEDHQGVDQQQQQQIRRSAKNGSLRLEQQQSPESLGGQSSSLSSWVRAPFRGWNSYAFWPSASPKPEAASLRAQEDSFAGEGSSQSVSQTSPASTSPSSSSSPSSLSSAAEQPKVQILRPMERNDQQTATNNDIITQANQTIKFQHRQQQQQQQYLAEQQDKLNGVLQASESVMVSTVTHNSVLGLANKQNQPLFQPMSPSSVAPNAVSQMRAPATPASLLIGVFGDFPATSQQQQRMHQHQHQQQFLQPDELVVVSTASSSDQCKCNTLGEPLDEAECRFRCAQQQQQLQLTTPTELLDGPTQLAAMNSFTTPPTSPTMATSSTLMLPTTSSNSIAPAAKMNPLDVTFLLYTRYHRDLAMGELSDAQLGSSASSNNLNDLNSSNSNSNSNNNNNQLQQQQGQLQQQQQQQQQNNAANNLASSSLINAGDVIDLSNETALSESRLNSTLPIKIVIHGFGSGGRRPWVTDMVYKLLDYEDVNVIVVDWEKGATLPNYVQAAGNTRLVGHKIACLIKSINAKYGLTGNSYHLIGFSLGAHVAGFAGMEIRNSTNQARFWINRITGLDPASPLFEGYEANDRLDPSDAQFVDVIHSNGDGVLRGGFGSLQPMGHVDFYPNGGRVQVGCNSVLLSALSDIIYGKWQSLCNHRRALNFFMDSFEFSKCRFRSFNCDSYENYIKGECFDCGFNNEKCSYMGYLANYSKGRGKMYLTTHEDAPFCANQFMIKIVGTKGFKSHWGKVEVTLVTLDGKNESFWLSSMSTSQIGGSDRLGESGQKELSQHSMQSLIVAHPTLVNFTQVLLRYTKYKGWIYSGDESWSIDKVFITDSEGQVKSFCGFNTVLESHITSRLSLEPGNCTVIEQPLNSIQQQQQQQQASGQRASGSPPISGGQSVGSGVPGSVPNSVGSPSSRQDPSQQQQSARTPRLFGAMLAGEPQTTPILPHVFQRMSQVASGDRSQQQQPQLSPFAINYNNLPILSF